MVVPELHLTVQELCWVRNTEKRCGKMDQRLKLPKLCSGLTFTWEESEKEDAGK